MPDPPELPCTHGHHAGIQPGRPVRSRRLKPQRNPCPPLSNATAPAEQLLLLGADFTRYGDAATRLLLSPSTTATDVAGQAAAAQHLARSTLEVVHAQRTPHSPATRTACARMLDLAKLTTDASGHLLKASDIIKHRRAGAPARDRGARRSRREALSTVDTCLTLVRDTSAFCAEETLRLCQPQIEQVEGCVGRDRAYTHGGVSGQHTSQLGPE